MLNCCPTCPPFTYRDTFCKTAGAATVTANVSTFVVSPYPVNVQLPIV
ncbi:MAG: hypothetical protein QM532_01325 [Cyanobium sp. MAG06]|nr:hypothetical protein [Cyanobium sp. MAG06]